MYAERAGDMDLAEYLENRQHHQMIQREDHETAVWPASPSATEPHSLICSLPWPVYVSDAMRQHVCGNLFVALCIDCNAKKTVFVSCFRMHEFATSRPAFRAVQNRSARLLRTQCAKCREFQGWNTMYEWLLLNYYKKTDKPHERLTGKVFAASDYIILMFELHI